jgi:putative sterol carrier protein
VDQPLAQVLAVQEAMLKAEPERTRGLNITFQFDLFGEGGCTWHLEIVDGEPAFRDGPAQSPDLTVIVSLEDYMAMAARKASGRELFFSGRMHLEGNAMLGMVLGQVLGEGSPDSRAGTTGVTTK